MLRHVQDLLKCKASITGQYLSGRREIAVPAMRREPRGDSVTIRGAHEHNLIRVGYARNWRSPCNGTFLVRCNSTPRI